MIKTANCIIAAILFASKCISVSADTIPVIIGYDTDDYVCTKEDSTGMILIRSKFWGTYQQYDKRLRCHEIEEVLSIAPNDEPYKLFRSGKFLIYPVSLGLFGLSLGAIFLPNNIDRYVFVPLLAGGLTCGIIGEGKQKTAIQNYNKNLCAMKHSPSF
jgi:hypothetical protein